ncbi:MAG: cadmium-translocating P-type ATPase [Alphaproteobacteria bacterium]|nr:cadmium-translocating P-type ATPase [Alphaproteobacteria bacterium]
MGGANAARSVFKVQGLDCAEEVAVLKREIGPIVGGENHLVFDVLNGRMSVLKGADAVNTEDIRKAVARTGMNAEEWRADRSVGTTVDRHRWLQALFTAVSGSFLALGLILHVWLAGGLMAALGLFDGHSGHGMPWLEIAAYGLAIAFGIRFVLPKAWFSVRRLRPDMNLLMIIAIAGAIGIGELFEGATVAFLFALSLALEGWSVGRARRAISALLDLAPPVARVLGDDENEREIPVDEIPKGSRFVIYPGQRIPLDGRVLKGMSGVNQAPITGESIPVEKDMGSELFAGTINGDGALEAVSTKRAADTTLARIIRMIEDAHSRRADVEQWVEKFAAIYTPVVILLAVGVAVLPPLVFGAAWTDWFYRALVLLVIACPCALVISTPVSIVAALAAAARSGVLIKGGVFMEVPAKLKALAMDKTGTITRGEPEVTDIVPLNGHSKSEILIRAATLEARSTHPLARAILTYAAKHDIAAPPAENIQMVGGKGVTGTFESEPVWLGSHRFLVERGQDNIAVSQTAGRLEREGKTVVVIGDERHVCGLIAIADTLRPGARGTIRKLHEAGLSHIIMLTGDNTATANAIAQEVGIDEVRAELLPQDKVSEIGRLIERYGTVAMLGDGVNDAPAMARASLGIAMGAAGSDAAIETADIALMSDDLEKLPWLLHHSKRTMWVIRQNIAFALGVKAAFVFLTFVGFATLWGAIAADVGASLLVVANGLRLLKSQVSNASQM